VTPSLSISDDNEVAKVHSQLQRSLNKKSNISVIFTDRHVTDTTPINQTAIERGVLPNGRTPNSTYFTELKCVLHIFPCEISFSCSQVSKFDSSLHVLHMYKFLNGVNIVDPDTIWDVFYFTQPGQQTVAFENVSPSSMMGWATGPLNLIIWGGAVGAPLVLGFLRYELEWLVEDALCSDCNRLR
jgi:hypothetical protein